MGVAVPVVPVTVRMVVTLVFSTCFIGGVVVVVSLSVAVAVRMPILRFPLGPRGGHPPAKPSSFVSVNATTPRR